MMLTRRNGTTIRNIPRVDPGARQPSRVAVTVTRLEDSSRVALSIGSDATNLVRSYDIPLSQFLQLVAAVVTADDLACAGIAPELASRAAVPAATAVRELGPQPSATAGPAGDDREVAYRAGKGWGLCPSDHSRPARPASCQGSVREVARREAAAATSPTLRPLH